MIVMSFVYTAQNAIRLNSLQMYFQSNFYKSCPDCAGSLGTSMPCKQYKWYPGL